MKAIWNNTIIAASKTTKQIEGNHYFPPNSLKMEYFKPSKLTSVCHWKGTASYYNVEVEGKVNTDAAWYYPNCSDLAKDIEGHVAFWRGVEIID